MLFSELSQLGVGPKLLGVFDGGRIEEFIPSHTLTPEEFNNESMIKDIAINTAVIHNVKLPFSQASEETSEIMRTEYAKWYANCVKIGSLESFIEKYRFVECGLDIELFKTIASIDWTEESHELKTITNKFQKRTGLVLCDNNFRNVLVREHVQPHQLKVCIIDYESCRYGDRVNDIASRFVQQLFNFVGIGKGKITGYRIMEEHRRRLYIREYLMECKRNQVAQDTLKRRGQESSDRDLSEEEIDQWMCELDHAILRNLINFCMLPFAIKEFLQQDANFIVSTN